MRSRGIDLHAWHALVATLDRLYFWNCEPRSSHSVNSDPKSPKSRPVLISRPTISLYVSSSNSRGRSEPFRTTPSREHNSRSGVQHYTACHNNNAARLVDAAVVGDELIERHLVAHLPNKASHPHKFGRWGAAECLPNKGRAVARLRRVRVGVEHDDAEREHVRHVLVREDAGIELDVPEVRTSK